MPLKYQSKNATNISFPIKGFGNFLGHEKEVILGRAVGPKSGLVSINKVIPFKKIVKSMTY